MQYGLRHIVRPLLLDLCFAMQQLRHSRSYIAARLRMRILRQSLPLELRLLGRAGSEPSVVRAAFRLLELFSQRVAAADLLGSARG